MKKRTRALSAMLCITMLLGMINLTAFAAQKKTVYINSMVATLYSPAEGEMPTKSATFSGGAGVELSSVKWFMGAKDGTLPQSSGVEITEPFVLGKTVIAQLTMTLPDDTDTTEYKFKTNATWDEYALYLDGEKYSLSGKIVGRDMIYEIATKVKTKQAAEEKEAAEAGKFEKYVDYTPFGRLVNTKVAPAYSFSQAEFVSCPPDYAKKNKPKELPSGGYAILRGGSVPLYFSKSTSGYARGHMLNDMASYGVVWTNYENARNGGVIKAAYPYSNVAAWYYTGSKFDVIEYDKDWITVWSKGEWDAYQFPGCAADNLTTNHKPGVYYIPASKAYVIDGKNLVDKKPEIKAYGKSTGLALMIKTTPDSNYSLAGSAKVNQTLEIVDPTPINGNYKVYYKGGIFYVSATYINFIEKGVTKPTISYMVTAKPVSEGGEVRVLDRPGIDAEILAKCKEGTVFEVIDLDDPLYAKIWFNSRVCYVTKGTLKDLRATAATAGTPIGTLAVDTSSRAYGVSTYMSVEFPKDGKPVPKGTNYKIAANDSVQVTQVVNHNYLRKIGNNTKKETETWYKVIVNGSIRWALGARSATYYPGGTYKVQTKANTQAIVINSKKYDIVAYNIKNNNYFKVRDIAKMISGTNASVSGEWDAGANAINLVSNFEYESVGGELQKGDGNTRNALLSNASLNLDGVPLGAACYNIDGNNYYKLRDVLDALGCRVEWDAQNNRINVSTGTLT